MCIFSAKMSPYQLNCLPVEILQAIGDFVQSTADVGSLVLSNKYLNDVLTPMLYSSIYLQDSVTAAMCITTLVGLPEDNFQGRDLATYVRVFSCDCETHFVISPEAKDFYQHLKRAVSRMTGLQNLKSLNVTLFTPSLCLSLFHAAAATLQSLDVGISRSSSWIDDSDKQALLGVSPTCPSLVEVRLDLCSSPSGPFFVFLRRLLSSHQNQLHTLFLSARSLPPVRSVLRDTTGWLVLERLELEVDALSADWLPQTPMVRSLTINGDPSLVLGREDPSRDNTSYIISGTRGKLYLPPTAFPRLEELVCSHGILRLFLPPNSPAPRPIRKIELDKASYWRKGLDSCPDWYISGESVWRALSYLPNSSAPVRELALVVQHLDMRAFVVQAGPSLKTLESLVLVTHEDPTDHAAFSRLGEDLFAHMPKLHTFILSDGPAKAMDECESFGCGEDVDRQRIWLELWEAHAPALVTVAFTNDFTWTKKQYGWENDKLEILEGASTESESPRLAEKLSEFATAEVHQ
ncbi:hypothetical protein VTO73DRAFT_4683 [Trametes versicolor]